MERHLDASRQVVASADDPPCSLTSLADELHDVLPCEGNPSISPDVPDFYLAGLLSVADVGEGSQRCIGPSDTSIGSNVVFPHISSMGRTSRQAHFI